MSSSFTFQLEPFIKQGHSILQRHLAFTQGIIKSSQGHFGYLELIMESTLHFLGYWVTRHFQMLSYQFYLISLDLRLDYFPRAFHYYLKHRI